MTPTPPHIGSAADDASHDIAIDLGRAEEIRGFAYTPQQENSEGMMAKGKILHSSDGEAWQEADTFEFGNLINDPSKRFHYLKNSIKTRYIKIVTTETTGNSPVVTAAEIDFF